MLYKAVVHYVQDIGIADLEYFQGPGSGLLSYPGSIKSPIFGIEDQSFATHIILSKFSDLLYTMIYCTNCTLFLEDFGPFCGEIKCESLEMLNEFVHIYLMIIIFCTWGRILHGGSSITDWCNMVNAHCVKSLNKFGNIQGFICVARNFSKFIFPGITRNPYLNLGYSLWFN